MNEGSKLTLDFLFGQSEVMTGNELFSKSWDRREMLRFRPRIRFILKHGEFFTSNPILIGLWTDLGVADNTADTYVVFVARAFP